MGSDVASRPIFGLSDPIQLKTPQRPLSGNRTVTGQSSMLIHMPVRLKTGREIEQKDKQTARTYQLAVESYEKWWGSYQG